MECMRDNFYNGAVLDGRFQTISPLNHGSFGMVFLAKDLLTNENVAIKCLTKQSAVQDDACNFAVDEKSEELACHALLGSHKNIVNLIHSFETENHIYLVLEFCSKGDLYEAIRTGCGPLETQHVRDFMLQLISAVEYVHSKGMYHRDIKPENIFLTEDGSMKLGDFGLATKDTWSYETTVGSDRYMAPEQYDSDGAGYSPEKADIWAIGIILLNVLFSRNPFTTPTEADPLFLDFSRDNQSLFDVFSDMSQDTFEVVLHCMSLDPKKRSLQAARDAINRVVTFTVSDELEDDFRTIMRKPIASANREPLRTPTIKTPQVEASNAFPWAKALNASPPQAIRQLSMIPDNESYSEDLFSKSEESSKDWFSVGGQTPYSSVGASVFSVANSRPMMRRFADLTPISGSLPINMAKPKSLASVFGKQEVVSKSWSDLYDEEFEEEQQDHQFRGRQAQNARTFSHDEVKVDETAVEFEEVEEEVVLATKSSSAVNIKSPVVEVESDPEFILDIDGDNVNDGFFFQNPPAVAKVQPALYSPPCKRNAESVDKWAALGARRRAYTGQSAEKAPTSWRSKKSVGMGTAITTINTNSNSTFGASALGVWDHKPAATGGVHKAKDGFWIRGKDHHHNSPIFSRTTAVYHHRNPVNEQENVDHTAKEGHHYDNLGDLEWVGGWGDSVAGLQL